MFTPHDVVEPDVLFVSSEHEADWLRSANASCVDLAIEIASPSTRHRDQTIKRDLYERAGVAAYWFVDPDANVVHVYRRTGDGFAALLICCRRMMTRWPRRSCQDSNSACVRSFAEFAAAAGSNRSDRAPARRADR